MMGALVQGSFTIAPKGLFHLSIKKKKMGFCHCQNGWNLAKADKLSTVVTTQRPVLMNPDHGAAIMDPATGLVLAPNGEPGSTISVKDLVPYGGGSSSTLVQVQEGIGIVKFLRGKSFFVTGATGFLAKVLIEKLLRTVPDVGNIYVLIKARNKEEAVKRLKYEIINAEIFNCLQQIHGKSYEAFMLSKLIAVAGNVCASDLGLDQDLSYKITEEVDFIVNSAANTNFHERYDVAIDINTRGPGCVMALAKQCHKLKLFLQVSTAYVNGQRQGRIMEKAFRIGDSIARENLVSQKMPSLLPLLDVKSEMKLALKAAQIFDDSKVAQKMKEIGLERARKYGWQDTYVFTKAMGEMLIGSMRGDVPVVILRPSVIESTYKDPFPGWIEGNRMMDPVVTYYGKGQLSGFPVDPNGVIDVVPADMVVNATLAAIAKHGMEGNPGISVYQVASSVVNPLLYRELGDLIHQHFTEMPYSSSEGRPIQVEPFRYYGSMEDFSSHIWRETIRHLGSVKKANWSRKMEKICRKCVEQAKHLASVYEPYSFYGGRFDNSSTKSLMEEMSEEERRTFHFDVGSIDWEDYICNVHIPGLRRHVMKGRGKPTG